MQTFGLIALGLGVLWLLWKFCKDYGTTPQLIIQPVEMVSIYPPPHTVRRRSIHITAKDGATVRIHC